MERDYVFNTYDSDIDMHITTANPTKVPTTEELTNEKENDRVNELKKKTNDEKLALILKEGIEPVIGETKEIREINYDKLRLEAMLLYYSINSDLVKIERVLRETKNVKLILLQKFTRAKESLALHDRILATQTSDARDYFGMLCAIYDSISKYTLPSGRLIEDLEKIQSQIELKNEKYEEKWSFAESITDSIQTSLNLLKTDDRPIIKSFKEMAEFIEQNKTKYLELERKSREIYNLSSKQRDLIQKDITAILQHISEVNSKLLEIETDYEKANNNMDSLLDYMQNKLEIQINNRIPSW